MRTCYTRIRTARQLALATFPPRFARHQHSLDTLTMHTSGLACMTEDMDRTNSQSRLNRERFCVRSNDISSCCKVKSRSTAIEGRGGTLHHIVPRSSVTDRTFSPLLVLLYLRHWNNLGHLGGVKVERNPHSTTKAIVYIATKRQRP